MKIMTMLLLAVVFGTGLLISKNNNSSFENLDAKQMNEEIVRQRDLAIQKAVENGSYKCCITPPCTMCYMEANEWNNYTAGTCACDDLIAQGKDPCPQCERGFCESKSEEGTCLLEDKNDK